MTFERARLDVSDAPAEAGARRRARRTHLDAVLPAPIVIVGAGVAGLATALAAAPRRVLLLCRDANGSGSASELAQGGIAAAIAPEDDPGRHVADTIAAGAGHNLASQVEWLCREARGTVAWLASQGVPFDRSADGELQLGREGGHRNARIVHAGGDATGAAIVRVLLDAARTAAHVEWHGGLEVDALLERGGRIVGVRAIDSAGLSHEFEGAVVLATGGLSALFARTSNPPGADGAGLALAIAAGAPLRDMEFVQFHPTALDVGGHCLPLLTEALRGAGATLQDARGRAFMRCVHPLGDLAPRDVVAREVWRLQGRGGAWLDARPLADDMDRCFPTVLASCLAHGFDPRSERLPVTAAAHFQMGGMAVDEQGRTSLPGLHAVGEVACTGVHGANRLASNSLTEGIACGRRLGVYLSTERPRQVRGKNTAYATRMVDRGPSLPPEPLERLRHLLWDACGPIRNGAALRRALGSIAPWQACGWQALVATRLLASALERRESLGAHFRSDAVDLR